VNKFHIIFDLVWVSVEALVEKASLEQCALVYNNYFSFTLRKLMRSNDVFASFSPQRVTPVSRQNRSTLNGSAVIQFIG